MQNWKPAPTPITFTRQPDDLLRPVLKPGEEVTTYRSCVGIARFLRKYRGDVNFAVKEGSQSLNDHTNAGR